MLVDLSQRFEEGMFRAMAFPSVVVERCLKYEEHGANATRLDMVVHIGTHLDAPIHVLPDGTAMDDVLLERVCGEAVCWGLDMDAEAAITVEQLETCTPAARVGDIVCLNTGWDRFFVNDHERYAAHPFLTVEAAEWIADLGVKLVVLDTPTPDRPDRLRPPGFRWPVHHILLGSGVLICEHAANLSATAGRRFKAYAFPLAIRGSDGSPVRLVGEL